MTIGTQIIAPSGYKQLVAGEKYHFLRNHVPSERVFLAHFSGYGDDDPKGTLLSMPREEFSEQIDERVRGIVRSDTSSTRPPWLEAIEDIDFDLLDSFRPKARKTHKSRVEEREGHIAPAVQDIEFIFSAEDPVAEMNRYARACTPVQNESRYRLWLLTYLAFGQDQWVLLPPYHRIGGWNRFAHPDAKKFGSHSIYFGKDHGHGMSEAMIETMLKGYFKFRSKCDTFISIYRETVKDKFGCVSVRLASGKFHFVQPDGKPFPSYWQFEYWIHKELGFEEVQRSLYGAVRHRSRLAPTVGKFSESVANLMQRVEADGYYTKERPRGYVDGSVLPPLCVVIGRDVLSGKKVGIGFAFGNEHSSAYRMMLFSMAVPKPFFASLFGIQIDLIDWNGEGLPILYGVDRGPGAKRNLVEDFEIHIPIRDLAPSWNGQSKATVESSHPRKTRREGQPIYVISSLTPVQLAVKEIFRLLKFNAGANMSSRKDIDPALVNVFPSPNELWDYYEAQLRTDAQPMSISTAVRTFLTPCDIKIDRNGAWYDDIRYDSDKFRESEMRRIVSRGDSRIVKGYILDLCLRHIWIEIDGYLMFLDMQRPIRESDEFSNISVVEQAERKDALAKVNSGFREHQQASAAYYENKFEQTTGMPWQSGTYKAGSAKSDHQETMEAK